MRQRLLIALIFAGVAATIVACARPYLPRPTNADAARASTQWPGTTTAQLEHGRSLYLNRCTACHQPVSPAEHTPSEWVAHVDEMKGRAHLDEEEAGLVKHYLMTMSDRDSHQASAAGRRQP